MCRLLIVDDEEIERKALRMIIERYFPEIEVVGESENGRMAIEMTDTVQPDLITMDIKMPGIDGVEAVQTIHEKYPDIRFIMVSAFDTFEYARKVMRNGVKEYLVKPCKKEKTIESIRRMIDEIHSDQDRKRKLNELENKVHQTLSVIEAESVSAILMNYIQDVDLSDWDDKIGFKAGQAYAVVITLSALGRELDKVEKMKIYAELRMACKQLEHCLVGPMSGSQIPLFVFPDASSGSKLSPRAHAMQFARKLTRSIDNHDSNVRVFIGIGTPYPERERYVMSYHEALLASRDPNLPSRIKYFEDLREAESDPFRLYPRDTEKALLLAIRKADKEAALDVFDRYLDELFQASKYELQVVKHELGKLFSVIAQMLGESGFNTVSFEGMDAFHSEKLIKELVKYQMKILIDKLVQWYANDTRGNMEKAKAYIADHYASDLSLEHVADIVQLNPYYFSKLFHERCGSTFVDFLTQIRIAKAKELLSDPGQSLKDISSQVGYRDPNYFSRVFKKWTGQSPTEFRLTSRIG
ncbi:response regulator [Paenibacillus sp. LHD-117]|uniref:response regulator n=1 Tax=Paenibacillus sp. LHD-117 TaxID=3071412 RepID=UPI0027E02A43|nr:response regulator [Paenibacillus sp. LHD-117]MDQ6419668.1 response regulator [Paenibacillus sp. LHD-117]